MKPIEQWKTGDPIGMHHIMFVSDLEQKVGALEDDVEYERRRAIYAEMDCDLRVSAMVERVDQLSKLVAEHIGPWHEDESWSAYEIRSLIRDMKEEMDR